MFKRSNESIMLQEEIDRTLKAMQDLDVNSEEGTRLRAQLSELYEIRELRNKDRIKVDTIALVAGNLIGIVLILNHERAHVISTKALGFVFKGRV